jgi:hypothetical protein
MAQFLQFWSLNNIYVYTFALWCCCASVATNRLSPAPLFGGWFTNWPPDIGDLYIDIYVHDIKTMKVFWKWLINMAIWKNSPVLNKIYVYTFALWCCCASVATNRLSPAPLFAGWFTNWPPDIGDLYIDIYVHGIKKMKVFLKLLINLAM